MKSWKQYLTSVLDTVQPFKLQDCAYPEDAPELIVEKERLVRARTNRIALNFDGLEDLTGASWPESFTAHQVMRKRFQECFEKCPPSIPQMRNLMSVRIRSDWWQLLPARDADVLHMHLLSYQAFILPGIQHRLFVHSPDAAIQQSNELRFVCT